MNKSGLVVFGLLISVVLSCDDDSMSGSNEFTVIVESTSDMACYLPIIHFTNKFENVRSKTSYETLVYNAYHLDNSLNVVGAQLIIEFEDVAPEDFRACNTLYIGYPGIAIINARRAN